MRPLPSDPNSLASLLAVPADSLRAAGEERYRRQEFDSARAIWRVELTRAQDRMDAQAAARVRMWLGLADYKLGDFKSARFEGEKSLVMKRQLHMDPELARSFNALGLLAWQEGRLHAAITYFDSAKASANRNHDDTGVARALSNIPLVQVELGDFDTARRGFLAALSAAKKLDDDLIQGNALANLGMLEIRLGNPTRAVDLLGQARKHYRTTENGAQEANALGQLATAWSQLGDLQRGLAAADSALAIATAEGLQQEVAAELEVLADLQIQAGSPRLALRRLAQADSIDAILGLLVERGTNLRRSAAILTELGEYPAAIARAERAVGVHHGVKATLEEIYDRLQLAQTLSLDNQPGKARSEADVAIAIADRTSNQAVANAVALVSARLALDSKDPSRAIVYLRHVTSSSGPVDWKVADLLAEALLAVNRLDDARVAGERAISALEHERASLGAGPLRSVYLASRSSPFAHLVAIHLARHDTAAAFAVAASLPGRNLSERFGGFVDAPQSLDAVATGEKLLVRAGTLEADVADLSLEPKNAERVAALQRALMNVHAAYEDQIARRATVPESRMLGLEPVTLKDVQSRLADDEALLTFLSGPTQLDLFVVRRGFYRHASVPLGQRVLAQRIRLAREVLAQPDRTGDIPAALGELYDLLVGPSERVAALAGAKRLLIVPHGNLGALPFAALWNRRTGKFLVEERTVSYLPAVSALTAAPRIAQNLPARLVVFAPLSDSLPGTLREMQAVQGLNPGSEARAGSASTESGVKAALRDGASVHIASHGLHNSQNPLFSRMIVGRSRRAIAGDDGQLDVYEILGLRTTSRLVFLSGCETGLGSGSENAFESGSEEGSLAQAFLIAGARTVVATLWRIADVEAVDIARAFYAQLRSGGSAADALAIAQRKAINRSGFSWAAYTVSGR